MSWEQNKKERRRRQKIEQQYNIWQFIPEPLKGYTIEHVLLFSGDKVRRVRYGKDFVDSRLYHVSLLASRPRYARLDESRVELQIPGRYKGRYLAIVYRQLSPTELMLDE